MSTAESKPAGTVDTDGIVHRRSPLSVAGTVDRLLEVIDAAGAKVFAVVDQDGEAERAGLSLRQTKLVIFGNPVGGTPVMQAAPLAALDLPLKILVWSDDAGTAWMTYVAADWLVRRYDISADLAGPLRAPDALTSLVAARD